MKTDKIINSLEAHANLIDGVDEPIMGYIHRIRMATVIREAVSLLKAHPDSQSNDPLTPEELREMDGQPVWLDRGPGYGEHWALVQIWAKSTNLIYFILNNGSSLYLKAEIDNGTKIYRRPPKENGNED